MLLENKIAVIYGGGGTVGGAVARAFAREGARVFLTGRNLSKELIAEGWHTGAAKALERQFAAFVQESGAISVTN